MAKILCAISGIQFTCEHVPLSMSAREVAHPIFYLPQKKLFGIYAKYLQGTLTDTDAYLLYLAGFNSTELVTWDSPAIRTSDTASIVANHIIPLFDTIGRMQQTPQYKEIYASIAVNSESKDLSNSHIWISVWNKNRKDYDDGYRYQRYQEAQKRREHALASIIKDSNAKPEARAKLLSKWAAEAGKFPDFQITNPLTQKQCRLSEYWMDIIAKCCREESIFLVPAADIDELIEHCEENISGGSIYAHSLFSLLKLGRQRKNSYLGLGDSDISTTKYRIVSTEATVEDVNKLAMIDSAPDHQPQRHEYPSELAFLRAKMKYAMAVEYRNATANSTNPGI